MHFTRRSFINISAVATGTGIFPGLHSCLPAGEQPGKKESTALPGNGINTAPPVTVQERAARIEKAQRLLQAAGMGALILDAGTSMEYFTGIRWWPSERAMVAVLPAKGALCYVCPAFEESRLRALITIGEKVYTWQEEENPYAQIVNAFNDTGVLSGKIGIEEQVRFFIVDGLQKAAPRCQYVSGDAVTIPCRLIKSAAEIALMQNANDCTVEAMKAGISGLQEGMTPADFSDIVAAVHQKLGAEHDFAMVNFGKDSAFPHGSGKPQYLRKGDMVLMDCGCRVGGYSSDISRTLVFGSEPTKRQMDIWNLEQKAQLAGFAAAKIGATCGSVDAAARKVITDAGFGPGYQLPGLPHRTGHGIGMDGHEWGNIVKGSQQLLQPGMCFSIEPTIAIVGEFGVRHEDCVYMTADGPRWFSQPSPAIGQPFV